MMALVLFIRIFYVIVVIVKSFSGHCDCSVVGYYFPIHYHPPKILSLKRSDRSAQILRTDNRLRSNSLLLGSEKCNFNDRTRTICKILSNSRKFREMEKKLLIPSTTNKKQRKARLLAQKEGEIETNRISSDEDFIHNDYDYYEDYDENTDKDDCYMHPYNRFQSCKNFGFRVPQTPGHRKLKPFKMKKLRNIWSKVLRTRNKIAKMPLASTGLPLAWTLGIGLMLKSHLKKPKMNTDHENQKVVIEQRPSPTMPTTTTPNPEKGPRDKSERIRLAKEVLGLTAESIALTSQKIDLINILAKTVQTLQPSASPFPADPSKKTHAKAPRPNIIQKLMHLKGENATIGTNAALEFAQNIAKQAIMNATNNVIHRLL